MEKFNKLLKKQMDSYYDKNPEKKRFFKKEVKLAVDDKKKSKT
jgi:hypothetical protein